MIVHLYNIADRLNAVCNKLAIDLELAHDHHCVGLVTCGEQAVEGRCEG